MQDRDGEPEHRQSEEANHAPEGVGEEHAAAGTASVGRTGDLFVQHFVEAVEDGADADDDVAQCAVIGFLFLRGRGSARAAPGLAAVFAGRRVAVGYDEDAGDGHGHGEDFVPAEFLVEERDGEGVGEEGRAVIDCGQVGSSGLVYGDVPGAAGYGQSAGHECGGADEVGDGGLAGEGCWDMEGAVLDHLGGGAEDADMSSPEGRPWGLVILEAEDEELGWPEEGPRAVCKVAEGVSMTSDRNIAETYSMLYALFQWRLCWM